MLPLIHHPLCGFWACSAFAKGLASSAACMSQAVSVTVIDAVMYAQLVSHYCRAGKQQTAAARCLSQTKAGSFLWVPQL